VPAYMIANVNVHDPELYREYVGLVPATLEPFGGRFVVRGGEHEVAEGGWRPSRLVIIEFPSMEHVRGWYGSGLYAEAMAIRHRAASTEMVFVDGA
jgi:uncharacterized protein (DUF1330 family)